MKNLYALLLLLAAGISADAQTYPSPTFNSLTANNTITGQGLTIGGALTSPAFIDLRHGSPNTGIFQIWPTALNRSAIKETRTAAGLQEANGWSCEVNGSVGPSLSEYDCGSFETVDESNGNASVGTNAVAVRGVGSIPNTNVQGAVWGALQAVQIVPGGVGQGSLIGDEIDVVNNGLAVTSPVFANLKAALWVCGCGGSAASTVAFGIAPGSGFYHGVWESSTGMPAGSHFLWLENATTNTPLFDVDNSGRVQAAGYAGHQGTSGTSFGNALNMWWTGSQMQLWVDGSTVGNITLTSDPRLKHNIETITTSALDTVMALRPVTFNWADVGVFKDDHQRHTGFLADEVQKVIPDAANGSVDAFNKDGTPNPMSLNPLPLISVLTKSVQELKTQLDAEHECNSHVLCRIFGIR